MEKLSFIYNLSESNIKRDDNSPEVENSIMTEDESQQITTLMGTSNLKLISPEPEAPDDNQHTLVSQEPTTEKVSIIHNQYNIHQNIQNSYPYPEHLQRMERFEKIKITLLAIIVGATVSILITGFFMYQKLRDIERILENAVIISEDVYQSTDDLKFIIDLKEKLDISYFEQHVLQNAYAEEENIFYDGNLSIKTTIVNLATENELPLAINIEKDSETQYVVTAKDPNKVLTPGLYELRVDLEKGSAKATIKQDFSWGVLVVNTNKSEYQPYETAKIAMAVLDEEGSMVCHADIKLSIADPNHITTEFSTKDGTIKVNDGCYKKEMILEPDFEANYQVGDAGTYDIELTAITDNGSYTIHDVFEVKNDIPFEIERITATRIYPPETYPVTLKIKANQDYSGVVQENVHWEFNIPESSVYTVEQIPLDGFTPAAHTINWQVDWQAGQEYILNYEYKAINRSPDFYLIGPLTVGDYSESRQWQIAADAAPTGEWWDTSYKYRQKITISAGSANVPTDYSFKIEFNHANLTTLKSQADGDDIRIAYWDGLVWTELDRRLNDQSSWDTSTTQVWFRTQAGISATYSDDNYYLYYGNIDASSPPTTWGNIFRFYDDFGDGSYTDRWACTRGTCTESGGTMTINANSTLWAGSGHAIGVNTRWEARIQLSDSSANYYNYWGGSDQDNFGGNYMIYWTNGSQHIAENNYSSSNISPSTPTSYHNYICDREGTSNVRYIQDTTQMANITSGIPTGNLRAFMWVDASSRTQTLDWVRVRNYVNPEPTSEYDTEENLIIISGTAYTDDDESTPLGSLSGVCAAVDGVDNSDCTDTDGSGDFSINMIDSISSLDELAIFINHASTHGNVLTVADGNDIDDIKLYQNHVLLRSETGSNISIVDINSYDNDQNPADMLFDAENDSPDTLTWESGTELYVPSGYTFTPGGNTNGHDIEIDGVWTASSGETIDIDGTFKLDTGGTFNPSTSTLTLDAASGTEDLITDGTGEIYNLVIDDGGGGSLVVEVEDPLIVENNLTINDGTLDVKTENNQINVGGNWTNDDIFEARNGTVVFDGATNATLDSGCADEDTCTNENFYNLTINKAKDAAVTLSNTHLRVTNLLNVITGWLIQAAQNIRSEGSTAIDIDDFGRWSNTSTGDITLGGDVLNDGNITLNANGMSCGDSDSITIASTNTTSRSWSGQGAFRITDVSVSYQTGSATVYAASSTSLGNMGANWYFVDCNETLFESINFEGLEVD